MSVRLPASARREQILDVSVQVFARNGFHSTSLIGVADAAGLMTYYGNDSRPFIISLDGWAGTQRYAGIWSGDQTGGEWEYIRFHIPTYLGSGLSGQPNICSAVDGIFGGKK